MNGKAIKVLVVAGGLSAAAMIIWPGCATPPLPSSRTPLAARGKDFPQNSSFVKVGHTTLVDVTNRLGAFDSFYPDMNIGAYALNRVTKKRLWLLFFVIPVGVSKSNYETENAYFELDGQDRVKRFAVMKTVAGLKNGAADWAISGSWICVSAVTNGTVLPEKSLIGLQMRTDGHDLRISKASAFFFSGYWHIHAEENPMNFSLNEEVGPTIRREAWGICSIRNDTLQVCYGLSKASRPTKFESVLGSEVNLITWKRKK